MGKKYDVSKTAMNAHVTGVNVGLRLPGREGIAQVHANCSDFACLSALAM